MSQHKPAFGDDRLPEAFWWGCYQDGDCWVHRAAEAAGGYGTYRKQRTHRYAYEVLVGRIPAGMELDHLCRRTSCCNPQHLEPVTHKENARRARIHRQRYRGW